jgi:hypothetical protein
MMLALLPLLLAAQPEPAREASSLEHIGEVIANARVCDAFGYEIDRQGLADWAAASRDAVAARDASVTSDLAQLLIERHVVNRFASSFWMYWDASTRPGRTSDAMIDTEYRFINLQRKACDRLDRSDAVGSFITAPEERLPASEVIARVRDEYRRIRLER